MATIASRSPPEPDWVALRKSLEAYYLDRAGVGVRDAAFTHAYQAIRYLARQVVARKLNPAQGSVTDVSEAIVDKVFQKSFTDIATSYDPENKASFRTWVTTVLTNAFFDWCRSQKNGPKLVSLGQQDLDELEHEWNAAVRDIADCDVEGEKRPGVVTNLIENEDHQILEQRKTDIRIAIQRLPDALREVILADEGGVTQIVAAARLNISLATYKRRRTLALGQLKEAIR